MSLDELLQEVQFVIDGEGHRTAVQLDLELWEKVVAWLQNGIKTQRSEDVQLNEEQYQAEIESLNELLDAHAVETGIPDLAEEHNHYLYGTPKRGN
jgi:Holliday junction resolvasome RuvABC DNA-binding subunit